MHSYLVYTTYIGVALAGIAVVMMFLTVFFIDLFIKSEQALRRWMNALMWCMVGGLFVTAVVTAWTVAQLHH